MIQIIINNLSDNYSVAELAQMAVEAGCGWIRLQLPETDEAFVREQAELIVPLCKEAGVMLTIDDRPDLAKSLGLHGVHLNDKKFNPVKVREELGPEAVIGVTTGELSVATAMKAADIDYVQLPTDFDDDRIAAFMVDFRAVDDRYPIVAAGKIQPMDVPSVMALGVSGVALSTTVTLAVDPLKAIKEALAAK